MAPSWASFWVIEQRSREDFKNKFRELGRFQGAGFSMQGLSFWGDLREDGVELCEFLGRRKKKEDNFQVALEGQGGFRDRDGTGNVS